MSSVAGSGVPQWVTINIVPLWMRYDLTTLSGYVSSAAGNHLNYPAGAARGSALVDDFDLQLTDDTGRVLAASDSVELADAIQVQVAAGTRLTLRASPTTSAAPTSATTTDTGCSSPVPRPTSPAPTSPGPTSARSGWCDRASAPWHEG
ncbi:hypothetical protein [Micromonospora sp. NPDC006431]|uniref:hypothetical protein n=1 Tax=Micromonospora sp. NPDC006431 TaxID=3364235 RepID=UPI0036AA9530